jgi:hypothetical protein
VKVAAKGSGRVSITGLICMRPGQRTRFIYRTITYHGRKKEKKGFGIGDLQALLTAAHHRLPGGRIVLVWDNVNSHTGPVMREFIDARAWLTVFGFPAYAPEPNPAEGVWANLGTRNRSGNPPSSSPGSFLHPPGPHGRRSLVWTDVRADRCAPAVGGAAGARSCWSGATGRGGPLRRGL